MSPEAQRIIAEVLARQGRPIPEFLKPALPRPKPVLVVNNDRMDGWGEFTVNPAYERWRLMEEADRATDRAHRRAIDPMNYGHWGPIDDE
jgi:hypothetical protein